MSFKLYLVTCKGMHYDSIRGGGHGIAYVVARNPHEAYGVLRDHLDSEDLGFRRERELETVKLIAEDKKYADCGTSLFGPWEEKP